MNSEPIETQKQSDPTSASASDSINPADPTAAFTSVSIENRLKAWVKFVEKDTQTQVQEYLEQIDAGQSGE
jgi:hypothetical protein